MTNESRRNLDREVPVIRRLKQLTWRDWTAFAIALAVFGGPLAYHGCDSVKAVAFRLCITEEP